MKLYIKNMVCNRCKMVVKDELLKAGLEVDSVGLGEVTLLKDISGKEKQLLGENLRKLGFDLIDDKKSRLIEQVKTLIIEWVHHNQKDIKLTLSAWLREKIPYDYNYLSNLFSEVEGITIEKFFILQKIERVKELLVYGELSLSEIADLLDYSSSAYLSNQFKKVTGLTPGHFRKIGIERRKPLDLL